MHHDVLEPRPLLVGQVPLDGEHSHLHALRFRGRYCEQVAVLPGLPEMQRVPPARNSGLET
eukprot:2270314-Lingulodinium_polyedra.AAC.1